MLRMKASSPDEQKLENRQYLESVEGVQINIKAKFK